MHVTKILGALLAATIAALAVTSGAATAPAQSTSLTIYSGREQALVKPIMDRFTRDTGIQLNVRYANTGTRRSCGRTATRAPSGTCSVEGRCARSVVPSRRSTR